MLLNGPERHCHRVLLWHMKNERELTVELERERPGTEIAPIRLAPDDLEPDTLRAVIESFVLREGTDYGVHEASLEDIQRYIGEVVDLDVAIGWLRNEGPHD